MIAFAILMLVGQLVVTGLAWLLWASSGYRAWGAWFVAAFVGMALRRATALALLAGWHPGPWVVTADRLVLPFAITVCMSLGMARHARVIFGAQRAYMERH